MMQKIFMISAVASAMLLAQETTQASLAEQLASKKVNNMTSSNGFTPEISLIVDASYTHQSWDEEGHTEHLELPGLVHGGGHDHEGHSHTSLAGEDGFNLNYAEMTIGASVDSYFDVKGVFHLTEDDFEIEEAFATTRALPYHLQLKLGKFKSDFGYLNNKHRHNYNFYETPLVYSALFGDHGLNEKGFQLQYVVPVSQYVMIGVEALRGENEQSFGTEGFLGVEDVNQPNLWLGYVKTSLDIGGGTVLAGASVAKGDNRINHLEDEEEAHAFAGETTLYGADLTYKYYMAADHAITWQSEYLYREMDGTKYESGDEAPMTKDQAGYYTELIYQHDKNWRGGVRYSAINQNDITVNGTAVEQSDDMYIASAMLEYNPSEFSRIRLQYNHNSSLYDEEGHKNNKNEFIVQFNYAIGAHGAHSF